MVATAQTTSTWTDPAALIGAVTGALALCWNILSSIRQRERLVIRFWAFQSRDGLGVRISITNVGTAPAYINSIETTSAPAWHLRLPGVRGAQRRRRSNWWVAAIDKAWRRATKRKLPATATARIEPLIPWHDRDGTVEPRRHVEALVKAGTFDDWIEGGRWLVVSTGLGQYATRLRDLRPAPELGHRPSPPPAEN